MQITSGDTVTMWQRARAALPYLIVFAVGVFLYYSAANFEFEEASGRIGPGAWPKLILLVMLAAALWGVVVSALQTIHVNLGHLQHGIHHALRLFSVFVSQHAA